MGFVTGEKNDASNIISMGKHCHDAGIRRTRLEFTTAELLITTQSSHCGPSGLMSSFVAIRF